jgi:hypothetical protein
MMFNPSLIAPGVEIVPRGDKGIIQEKSNISPKTKKNEY